MRVRRLLLEGVHTGLGAEWIEEEGWRVPDHYGDASGEIRDVLQSRAGAGCAVADLSHFGQVEVQGPDAGEYLHRVLTQDIRNLGEGCAAETCAVDHKGKILAWGPILRLEESRFVWTVEPSAAESAAAWLERYAITDEVEVQDRTEDWGLLLRWGTEDGSAPPDGKAVRETKCERWVLVPADTLEGAWKGFVAEARPVGFRAREAARIEAGRPSRAFEWDAEPTPWDLHLEDCVSLDKGCYTGQETLNRLRTYGGVRVSLVRVRCDKGRPPARGQDVHRPGEDSTAGRITSVAPEPDGGVALAIIQIAEGSGAVERLEWESGSGRVEQV